MLDRKNQLSKLRLYVGFLQIEAHLRPPIDHVTNGVPLLESSSAFDKILELFLYVVQRKKKVMSAEWR